MVHSEIIKDWEYIVNIIIIIIIIIIIMKVYTCCGKRRELIHVYKFKVGNRKYKNTIYLKLPGLGLQKCLKTVLKIRFTRNY